MRRICDDNSTTGIGSSSVLYLQNMPCKQPKCAIVLHPVAGMRVTYGTGWARLCEKVGPGVLSESSMLDK